MARERHAEPMSVREEGEGTLGPGDRDGPVKEPPSSTSNRLSVSLVRLFFARGWARAASADGLSTAPPKPDINPRGEHHRRQRRPEALLVSPSFVIGVS